MGHKGTARDEKQQAGSQSGKSEVEKSGEPIHLIFARLIFASSLKRNISIWTI
jgi:hypothetical protein